MKSNRLLVVLPFLIMLALALGCDSDNDIKAQDEQEPSPESDGVTCPCYTVSDIVTAED